MYDSFYMICSTSIRVCFHAKQAAGDLPNLLKNILSEKHGLTRNQLINIQTSSGGKYFKVIH